MILIKWKELAQNRADCKIMFRFAFLI